MNLSGISFTLLLIAATHCVQASESPSAGEAVIHEPGYRTFEVQAGHHENPFSGVMYYPANEDGNTVLLGENPVFQGVNVRQDAGMAKGRFPVLLLSHGLGGHTGTLSWLGAELARQGVMVVAVNHPNSTTRDFDMLKGLDHWTRVLDLQAALHQLAADPVMGASMDMNSLHAAGFSYGGWTALSMGGVSGNLAGYAAHCKSVGTASTHCADITRAGIDLSTLDSVHWDASYKDKRIKSVIAIDPGLLYGIQRSDVVELVDNVLLIGLGEGKDRLLATDFSDSGSGFAAMLPNATISSIAPANHFSTFLLCKPIGAELLAEEGDDPVCTDPVSADRQRIHEQVIEQIAAFIER
ncbi:alpha/beta hydrolase family protein [Granulosicoccus antarcticus]|uniref:Dienelactone hydrolase n=1 Tax=Granulosicoccus antarcticus IMCC3135 TaxID=1192854 RepID=A0A2Z2P3M5_9GAMM|nr:hypothetical protein [Granulosicoccus antarcticus]ASJ76050.1 hypothetical protein IMCC3135_30005 [Granulosicoccus antarcticus IMCC3135]